MMRGPQGEHCVLPARVVVAGSRGVFTASPVLAMPARGLDVPHVWPGRVVGTVNGFGVQSCFFGRFEGFLARSGERVRTSAPVAWLTTLDVDRPRRPAVPPTVDFACEVVSLADVDTITELIGERPVDEVFSAAERRHCHDHLERYAGRLAAKRAVVRVLRLAPFTPLDRVEILPGRHLRTDGPCDRSHAPEVWVAGDLLAAVSGRCVTVSISHSRSIAVAVCAVTEATAAIR